MFPGWMEAANSTNASRTKEDHDWLRDLPGSVLVPTGSPLDVSAWVMDLGSKEVSATNQSID